MTNRIEGKKVAFLVANEGIEQVELTRPWQAVQDAGGQPVLIAPNAGTAQGFNHLDKADTFEVDLTTADASPDDFDSLVLPGGVANPDALRQDDNAVQFVRDMVAQRKPVAAICHAPWMLIEAGVVSGRKVTSWPSLKTDLINAGAEWVDEEVVVDDGLTTSRKPDDLDAFCEKVVEETAEGKHREMAASV